METLPVMLQKAREVCVADARDTLARFELTEQQWRVIRAAYESGDLNAQELADKSAILGPSLSRILNRLEADGILSRKASEGDLRELTIKLTAVGKRLHNRVQPHLQKNYNAISAKLGQRKAKQLTDLLNFVIKMDQ